MKILKTCICILALGLVMVACGDDSKPELTITSPEDGTTYAPGDIVEIRGTAMDDVEVVNITVTSILLGEDGDVHPNTTANPLSYDLFLDIELSEQTAAGDYDIILTANDSDGNTDSETVSITIQ